ncbi:MAG: hypothetical protein LBI48_12615 [Burkholderiaceae bacterium]|jgi:hypothetical protein|nr:hypothetical protein [Burkholderiaceae bacterium]
MSQQAGGAIISGAAEHRSRVSKIAGMYRAARFDAGIPMKKEPATPVL